jgi:hypothetical protein
MWFVLLLTGPDPKAFERPNKCPFKLGIVIHNCYPLNQKTETEFEGSLG